MTSLSKIKVKELIGPLVKKPVILDIGSYDGSDAAQLAALFDQCEIHCFEADSRSIKLFEEKNGNNPELKLWKVAIGAESWKKIKFYKSERINRENWSASSSIRKPKNHLEVFEDISFNETEEVDVCTLDMWHWFHDIEKIDFIWCDVNGAEEDVIKGGLHVFNATRFVYIEYSDSELYEGQINKEKLLSLLPDFEELQDFKDNAHYGNLLLRNKNL